MRKVKKLTKNQARDSRNKKRFDHFAKPEEKIDSNQKKRKVLISDVLTVKNFSEISQIPVAEIITELFKSGILATINDTIDFETAAIIGDDLGIEVVLSSDKESEETIKTDVETKIDKKSLKPRPPVVTVMGHVDHGKTTLLDKIRQAHVADSESGGITQHISAYQVTLDNVKHKEIKSRTITFIDTPGHAAFSALRGHGAAITDIVVLIVAANDGVMPQTAEVIEQAKKNNVPIIVAINKIDLPDANLDKVKQQLAEYDLVTEEWGGKTIMIPISAKTGKGLPELLEMILLQADMMDLKANPDTAAVGVVIESHMHKGAGALALVLIENGTLRKGDAVQIGSTWGRVRIIENFVRKSIDEAPPAMPVRIAGLRDMPGFGDKLIVFESEKEAREAAQVSRQKTNVAHISTAKKLSNDESGEVFEELKIIIKADVRGSLEALKKMISEIKSADGAVKIVSEGIGAVSESDVTLAKAVNAEIYGFRTKELIAAKKFADNEEVKIKLYDVIYELIDDVKKELSELLPPLIIEEELGNGQVLAIFRDDKKGMVFGGKIEKGKVSVGDKIKVTQNENLKWQGDILSLRKEKNEVKEADAGQECGVGIASFAKVAPEDRFVVYKIIEQKRIVQ